MWRRVSALTHAPPRWWHDKCSQLSFQTKYMIYMINIEPDDKVNSERLEYSQLSQSFRAVVVTWWINETSVKIITIPRRSSVDMGGKGVAQMLYFLFPNPSPPPLRRRACSFLWPQWSRPVATAATPTTVLHSFPPTLYNLRNWKCVVK